MRTTTFYVVPAVNPDAVHHFMTEPHSHWRPRYNYRPFDDDRDGMADPVEEIRVAEGDVPRAGGDLRPHIGEHDVAGDDTEPPVVDRHHRTVPAAVLAAAAGLGVSRDSPVA